MKRPVVISLCDKTGNMVLPWAEAGYICLCVDVQHSIRATRSGKYQISRFEGGGEIHFLYGDVRSWNPLKWRKDFHNHYYIAFVSCFTPCTDVAGSGAQDWILKGLSKLTDALILFNSCEQVACFSGAPFCLENPVGAIPSHHRKPDHYFHPWMYGDMYSKYTCLWTGNGFRMPPPH